MLKKELAEKILESLDESSAPINIDWNFKDKYIKAILKGLDGCAVIEETHISHCQSCGKEFNHGDVAYYAVIDNNIVCPECAQDHQNKEVRIVD